MIPHIYLVGVILLGLIWLLFWYLRKDLRQHQMLVSLYSAPLAPISQIFFFSKDYWNPEYVFAITVMGTPVGIEEPLFAFFVGGIGAVCFEVVRKRHPRYSNKSRILLSTLLLIFTALTFLILKSFDLNTVWASTYSLLIGAMLMVLIDRDLIRDAIFSGVFFVLIAYIIYFALLILDPNIFNTLWLPDAFGNNWFLKVPLEESLWFLAWGAFSGILYEFYHNVESYERA